MMQSHPLQFHARGGFSLIELMVTISIVVVVTSIALVRYTSFNSALLLTNQAYEVALDIRQAQVFGVSVTASQVGGDENRSAIGIAFSQTDAGTPSPQSYVLFSDADDDGVYDVDEASSGSVYTLDPRFVIASLRAGSYSTTASCDELAITFKRPDFDAIINCDGSLDQQAEIVVTGNTDRSATTTVVVSDNGQISVRQD